MNARKNTGIGNKTIWLGIFMAYCSLFYGQYQQAYQSNSSYQKPSGLKLYLDSARYLSQRDPMKAVEYINKAIEESVKKNDKESEALSFLILGDIQQHLGQHDMAIENYKKSIRVYQNSSLNNKSNSTIYLAHKHAAASYLELNNVPEAEKSIQQALNNSSAASGDEQQDSKRLLAEIRMKKGKIQESRATLTEVLKTEQLNKNTAGEVKTLIAIGRTYMQEYNETAALEYFTKAKELAEKNKQNELTIEANDNLASVYRKQKKIDKEVETRNSNIQLNQINNNAFAVNKQNIEIGNAYLNVNQTEQAANYIDNPIQQQVQTNTVITGQAQLTPQNLFSESDNLEESARAYKNLAEQYIKQKEFSKAIQLLAKYSRLEDSIKKVRQKELEQAIAISTNIGKNQQRIDLLEKERELTEKSIDILTQDKTLKEEQLGLKNGIIISLCVLIALMLFAVFLVIRSSREKRMANQQLALKSLRGQMNPHFIFNALNSVNHYVAQNDERKANRYLSDFSKLMRSVMDSSKHDFIPLSEEMEMLRLYLQLEHARFNEKFDYSITMDEEAENGDWQIPPMLIQPYLENAVWHGLRYKEGKGKLDLKIEHRNNTLLITITDDGIGRKRSAEVKTQNQKKQNSLGMQNTENRIRIMNELFSTQVKISVEDAYPQQTDCGTKVRIEIPEKKGAHA